MPLATEDSSDADADGPLLRRRGTRGLGLPPDDERDRQVGVGPRRPVTPEAPTLEVAAAPRSKRLSALKAIRPATAVRFGETTRASLGRFVSCQRPCGAVEAEVD